jgi:hypothetical protein
MRINVALAKEQLYHFHMPAFCGPGERASLPRVVWNRVNVASAKE